MIMIKHPAHFIIGLCCALCFVFNVMNGRDSFSLIISAIGAIGNLLIAVND